MIQKINDIDKWHSAEDPWNYNNSEDDNYRKQILLKSLNELDISFKNVLDIGCGQGFITKELPGRHITGIDISKMAIQHAKKHENERFSFKQGSIFETDALSENSFDLIIITGVLYSQYIGHSMRLVYLLIDRLLSQNGILLSVHINDWYYASFPYFKIKETFYPYRKYTHKLEIYRK